MCRISGIISKQPADLATLVASMRDCMQHGGPDDAGIYVDQANGVAFGHRRLSIIDLSEAGHQPMSDDDGNLQISFNGEIFNFQELKEELLLLGHRFRTQTDTEVILKAYLQWGNKAWSRLNGMYALSLYDKRRNIVILVRDHAGIKPLYYSHKGSSIYFSSEVKAFKTIDPHWPEDPNWKIFFLAFGHLPEPVTTLNAVHPLKKGHFMEINLHNLTFTIQPFNEFRFTSQVIDEQEAIQMIRQELDAAVKRHLIADAPIGLFLSGGIDSSILTLIAKKYKPDNLYTLSINFDQSEFSEKYYQDIIIKKTGAHHQSFRVTQKDFEEKALDIFKAMDQPSADGINTYFISKYAHEYGLKAVLSGLGADELLGGYPSFRYSRRVGMIRRMPAFITGGISRNFLNDRFRKMDYLTLRNDVGEYLFYRGIFITRDIARILGTTEEDVSRIINKVPHHDYTVTLSSGNRASELELNYYMQNQLLKDSDYMSMWHGLEIRVPFLDKYFMQLVYSIEPGLKFNHRQGKHLLIKAFEDILPREVWDRKKQGFTFPFSKWFPQSDLFRQYQDPSHQHYYNLFNTNHLSWGRIWTIFIADYYGQQIH